MESDKIRYKQFKRSVRGYSPDEVDDLLDSVADELDEARGERDRLSGELEEARRRIEQYESLEGSIRATLDQAEKAASDYQEAARRDAEATVEAAKREAEVVIHDAEASARRTLADSSSKVERVQRSYEAMQEARNSLDADLRQLLGGYLQHLDDASSSAAREIERPLQQRLDTEAISAAHAAADEESRKNHGDEAEPQQEKQYSGDESSQGERRAGENEAGAEAESTSESREPEDPGTGEGNDGSPGSEGQEENESPRRGRFLRRRG